MTALNKTVSLPQLEAELIAAGVEINGLGTTGDPPDTIFTYNEHGTAIDLPAGAAAVLAAHVPEPPPPSDAAGLMEALATIDVSGNTAIEEMSYILMGFGALATEKGGW